MKNLVLVSLFAVLLVLSPITPARAQEDSVQLTVIHASPGITEIDVLLGGELFFSDISFGQGQIKSAPAGPQLIQIFPSAEDQVTPYAELQTTLRANRDYTLILYSNEQGQAQLKLVRDDLTPPQDNHFRIRAFQFVPDIQTVQISFSEELEPLKLGRFGDFTIRYTEAEEGTYDLQVFVDGQEAPAVTIPRFSFEASNLYSVILTTRTMEGDPAPKLQPIIVVTPLRPEEETAEPPTPASTRRPTATRTPLTTTAAVTPTAQPTEKATPVTDIAPSATLAVVFAQTSTPTKTTAAADTSTPTPTATSTPRPTKTPAPTSTNTPPPTPTATATAVPTKTFTPTATDTHTATATPTATNTTTPVPTSTATATPEPKTTPVPIEIAAPDESPPKLPPSGSAVPFVADTNMLLPLAALLFIFSLAWIGWKAQRRP